MLRKEASMKQEIEKRTKQLEKDVSNLVSRFKDDVIEFCRVIK